MKKKLLSLLLTIAVICSMAGALALSSNAVDSGKCGENLTWSLSDSGVLTISGEGKMENYDLPYSFDLPEVTTPWGDRKYEIKKVIIKNGVTTVGDNAFSFCENIESVTLPDSITSIGDGAFGVCHFHSITFPKNLVSIGDSAFHSCGLLGDITLPKSVTSIGKEAFYSCISLRSMKIPDGVTSIDGVFKECQSLTSVTLPNSVTSIGESAFHNCRSLSDITIPNSVKRIEKRAFYGCASLSEVTIPSSVTAIDERAFENCENLRYITIPMKVTQIGTDVFANCNTDYNHLTIYGFAGSAAESAAKRDSISFAALASNFKDIVYGAWYYLPMQYAVSNGLFNGVSKTEFAPNAPMTRAMLVKVLHNKLENCDASFLENPFADVKEGEWYTDAVKFLAANGIVNGTEKNKFSPDAKITREQLVAILYRYAKWDNYNVTATNEMSSFPDASKVSNYAIDAMRWAVGAGLISGNNINGVVMLDPLGYATRAQVAMILKNFNEKVKR